MKGYIIYSTYETLDDTTQVQLFGRLENNQSFATLNKFSPHFFIKEKDAKKIPKKYKTEPAQLKNFHGEKVVKVICNTIPELNALVKELGEKTETYEADLRPYQQFLIEKNILGTINIDGDYESSEKVDRVYKNPEISPAEFTPKLKILSLDIESGKPGDLYCIGLSGDNYKTNFMITNHKLKNTISCKDEFDCLTKFRKELIKQDPDVIIGWNVIDFDLVYLKERFLKNKIPFDLGRTNDTVRLRIESSFVRSSSCDIPGRQVLDCLNLIQDPFIKEAPSIKQAKFESYTLEDVSQELMKKGKLIKGKKRHEEIDQLFKKNTPEAHQKLSDYNLLDCELAYDILKLTKMIELAIERTQLTGLTLDRLMASIAAFDSLYIRTAHKKSLVSPTMHYTKKEERIKGGFVQSLQPGIYKNVLVFDFKSLYPSIIRTFNIDPASYLDKKEKNSIEAPNKAHFINQDGILPEILDKLHAAREKAKKEKRELSNYAIKIIMASFFGVLASPNCRYFNLNIANAITHFGQSIIKLTAKEIENKFKVKVIYSDTDSVFVETNLSKEKANALAKEIQDFINSYYENYAKKNFQRISFLELQFEKQYLYLMIPAIRKKDEEETAAKKRYAGLIEKDGKEILEIVGLEAIRGDWTEAAKEFQRELLAKIFHNEKVEPFIKDYIKKIKEGELDKQLIYKKSIRKELEEYTKTTPPHVKAARQLPHLESNIIEYCITTEGPEPIQKLRHKLDHGHYIDKQIKPIAEQILLLFNKSFDDIVKNSKQSKLF